MNYISLFSGIGGFDLAFKRVGMTPVAVCEIDKNCQNILRRHFPEAELYDDVRKVGEKTHERNSIDLVCGGFPCQDLSIAGKRAGLAGERSGLWYEFARIIDELEPQWVVAENVLGLLSSDKGGDFLTILRWLAERGYGVVWRVLDAQYFGVPQRRRRVFIVGSLGDGRAAEILFECESMSGNTPPRREAGKDVAYSLRANPSRSGDKGDGGINTTMVYTEREGKDGGGKGLLENEDQAFPLRREINHNILSFMPRKTQMGVYEDVSPTMHTGGGGMGAPAVAFQQNMRDEVRLMNGDGQIAGALSSQAGMKQQNYTARSLTSRSERNDFETENFIINPVTGVRRLTPTECERLQGFPDGWTAGQSDTARYRQLGNAVAVPVLEWIGRRIMDVR